MKKFERALSMFFITATPCFVLLVVFFLLIKEEPIFSIMFFAFILLLVYVCALLWRDFVLYTRNKFSERDNETANRDGELSNRYTEELKERIDKLEKQIGSHYTAIKTLDSNQKILESKYNKKVETLNVPKITEAETKKEEFNVSYNPEELAGKKELTSGDQFTITRNGYGIMALKDFSMLTPNAFEEGIRITEAMHEQWKSYSMEKLFDSNSRDMIDFKITKIIPAQIRIVGNENEDTFKGILERKGRMELERHM